MTSAPGPLRRNPSGRRACAGRGPGQHRSRGSCRGPARAGRPDGRPPARRRRPDSDSDSDSSLQRPGSEPRPWLPTPAAVAAAGSGGSSASSGPFGPGPPDCKVPVVPPVTVPGPPSLGSCHRAQASESYSRHSSAAAAARCLPGGAIGQMSFMGIKAMISRRGCSNRRGCESREGLRLQHYCCYGYRDCPERRRSRSRGARPLADLLNAEPSVLHPAF